MHQHNHSEYHKRSFTYKNRPWKVIHLEFFSSEKEARLKEKNIKGRGALRYLKERAVGTLPQAYGKVMTIITDLYYS